MTAQIEDVYMYQDKKYSIIALSKPLDFKPQKYSIIPQAIKNFCWNGFWCEYNIDNDGIKVKNLYINSKDKKYPSINGVYADEEHILGHHLYRNIDLYLNYSGSIVAGSDFINNEKTHLGYLKSFAYKIVKEFVFEEGRLIHVIDHSSFISKINQMINHNCDIDDEIGASSDSNEICWWL